jgi:uncharacterized membrane protein YgcG
MDKKELWLKLKKYSFNHLVVPGLLDQLTSRFGKTDPSLRALAGKIARKHGWKTGFAIRALNEYKKFIYLGLVSDFQVTPSRIIDVVWHEHILFSKGYRDFCNEVIGQSFDHYPELVPEEQQTGRFSAQYLDTIDLYRAEFGLEPPIEIWGDTKFDKEQVKRNGYQSAKKKQNDNSGDGGSTTFADSTPLYTHFESEPASGFPEFSGFGGGDFDGGGAGSSWGDSSDSGSDSGGDSGGCSGGCGGGD